MSNQYVMIYNLCCLIFIWPIYLIFTYLFVNFIFIHLFIGYYISSHFRKIPLFVARNIGFDTEL